MKQETNPIAERDLQPMLWVGKVPFVPHYTKRHLWVSPGRGMHTIKTTTQLMELGAKLDMQMLWPRHWTRGLNLSQ